MGRRSRGLPYWRKREGQAQPSTQSGVDLPLHQRAAPSRQIRDPWATHDPGVPTSSTVSSQQETCTYVQPSQPSEVSVLPPGWEVGRATSGESYYFHKASGASSWSVPSHGWQAHYNPSLSHRTIEVTTIVKVSAEAKYKTYWDPNVKMWYRRLESGQTEWQYDL